MGAPRMSDAILIQARNLFRAFGPTKAVDGVSIAVRSGEIYGLVGSDGAGKTTTMRLMVGALLPDSGEITIGGYDVRKQTEQARSQLGYLSQRFSMYEDLTVLENIRFFAEVRGLKPNEWYARSKAILEFVGLGNFASRRAGQLSGGMKQKLGLASALVSQPRVLLLDEPTTGVDPATRQDFWQLLLQLTSTPLPGSEKGGETPAGRVAVLISTPYMDEAARCTRVGFLRHGKMIAEDTPAGLRSRLTDRILELRGSPLKLLRQVALRDPDVEDVRAFGDRLHLRMAEHTGRAVARRLPSRIRAEGGTVDALRLIPAALEDVFIELAGPSND